ncbi:unnamed protein product [Ambrosiozyma monospora]|uniref:Unnamed protein product n=1 Tax=Ambrosiozyma monospora TaxID=43982 RepID=A0A9W7DJ93_AMBMO|nr:unnamed protein product [Ambrosiozyma monospora]
MSHTSTAFLKKQAMEQTLGSPKLFPKGRRTFNLKFNNEYSDSIENIDLEEDDDDPYKKSQNSVRRLMTVITFVCVSLVLLMVYTATDLFSNSSFGIGSFFHSHLGLYYPTFDPDSTYETSYYDLKDFVGSPNGWQYNERIIFCVPLRDAAPHLPMFFGHMKNMTYPHNLIDLAFLVSDSSDDTMGVLVSHLEEIQNDPDQEFHFGQIEIYEKDFGQAIGQGFSDRHGFEAQGSRRKLMARARNWLSSVAIKPYHSWVYWRDVDVETIPTTIIEDLMHHDKDVIVPNVWRPLPEWLGNQQPYDLNSWQESDGGLQLASTLDEDAVIVEGYVEYATWRPHLAYLRDPYGDPETEMVLDGIGGVSILSKAKVFKSGAHFPAFSFEKHAETEAFERFLMMVLKTLKKIGNLKNQEY